MNDSFGHRPNGEGLFTDPRDNGAFRAAWDKLATDPSTTRIIDHLQGLPCDPKPRLDEVVAAFYDAGALFPRQVSDVIRICGGPLSALVDLDADVFALWNHRRHRQTEHVLDREEAHKAGIPRPMSLAAFLRTATAPEFLVEPLLQRGYLYTLTAPTFHGKTTVLILLALCVAVRGRRFAGLHTKQGRVVIFAGENTNDTAEKLRVACDFLDLDPEDVPITVIPGAFDLTNSIEPALLAAAADGPVALIIIDTSAAYRFDEDEHDNQTSKQWGQTLRQFTLLNGRPVVIVAAHPIKHAKLREDLLPRGGGGFLNEVDSNLSLLADLEARTTELHWTGKHRGAGFAPIGFELRDHPHPSWTYSDGSRVMMTVAVPNAGTEVRAGPRKLTGDKGRAYELLCNLILAEGVLGITDVPPGIRSVSADAWRDKFYSDAKPAASPDAKRKAFQRVCDDLVNPPLRAVGLAQGRVWVAEKQADRSEGEDVPRRDIFP